MKWPKHSKTDSTFLWFSDLLPVIHPEFYFRLDSLLQKNKISHGLLPNTRDIWARDYMPVQIGENEFIQFVYDPDYLKQPRYRHLKSNPDEVCEGLNILRTKSNIVVDGGNVIRNEDRLIMCDKVFNENSELDSNKIIDELITLFKTDKILFIPWNRNDYTGHADGMVRFIDETNVLINATTNENSEHDQLLRESLSKFGLNFIELPYNPPHDPTYESAKGLYLNYLELEQVVIVPAFGEKEDDQAVKIFERVFGLKPVLPIECNDIAVKGGVLNCISWNVATSPTRKG